jgi:hypothetical protein
MKRAPRTGEIGGVSDENGDSRNARYGMLSGRPTDRNI